MPLTGKNIIGNGDSSEGSQKFRAINPATGQELPTDFVHATPGETDRAVELADAAFRQRGHGGPAQTVELLGRAADEIEAFGAELVQRCHAETGLPKTRVKLERGRTCQQLRMFAELVGEGSWVDARIDRAIPNRRPVPKPDMRRMLIPLGPVAVFPASNFPLAFSVAGGDTASALAAGCPVIVKARPAHPGTSELIARAVQKAVRASGMPDGWFSMLHGTGRELGMSLVRHPAIRAVGFTGSLSGGRTLCDAAAARPEPIPVYAEMGSINPVFLMPGALAERAEALAEGLHASLTLGVGQFCTNPGLVVAVEGNDLDRFVGALRPRIESTEPGTMLLSAIRQSYEEGTQSLAEVPGVERVAQSSTDPDRAKTQCGAALFVTDAETFLNNDLLSHEVFGPSTLVVRCRDVQATHRVAEHLPGQLTATLHAVEGELADDDRLLSILQRKAGRVLFGGYPTGLEVCPSTHHGGPYPASSDAHFTSVGTAAIHRFARPICYQDFPQAQLPLELQDRNHRGIWRLIDGEMSRQDVPPK